MNINNCEYSIKDRLPSNNISFQSATICTIPEIHGALSTCNNSSSRISVSDALLNNGMDIRATGVVLYTDVKYDFVIIGDALHKPTGTAGGTSSSSDGPTLTMTTTTTPPVHAHTASSVTTPTAAHKNTLVTSGNDSISSNNTAAAAAPKMTTITRTPLLGKKRKLITVKKKSSHSLLLKKSDKKLIYHQKNTSNQNLQSKLKNPNLQQQQHPNPLQSSSPRNNPFPTAHETPLIKTSRIDPNVMKIIQRKHREGMKIVLIDFRKGQHKIVWKVGDLIMVIGKVFFHNKENTQKTVMCGINDSSSGGDADDDYQKHCYRRVATMNDMINLIFCNNINDCLKSDDGLHQGGYIEARIMKNANGTDVNLMQEGLKLRRKYLERIDLREG